MAAAGACPAVEHGGISKRFGGVRALDDVDFEVLPGEVHALLGGNGAGKSTILKVLNGVHKPDAGTIDGRRAQPLDRPSRRRRARAAGIAMNFQEMSLVPTLTVAQNIFLTREATHRHGPDRRPRRRERQRGGALRRCWGSRSIPTRLVGDLGAGQQQLTEIAKAISQDARVLVLDEPSTALAVSRRRAAVRLPAQAEGARAWRSSTSATAWTRSPASPTARPSCATARHVDHRAAGRPADRDDDRAHRRQALARPRPT